MDSLCAEADRSGGQVTPPEEIQVVLERDLDPGQAPTGSFAHSVSAEGLPTTCRVPAVCTAKPQHHVCSRAGMRNEQVAVKTGGGGIRKKNKAGGRN